MLHKYARNVLAVVLAGLLSGTSSALGQTSENPRQHDAAFYAYTAALEGSCELLQGFSLDEATDNFDELVLEASTLYNSLYGISIYDAIRQYYSKEPSDFLPEAAKYLSGLSFSDKLKQCAAALTIVRDKLPGAERHIVVGLLGRWSQEDGRCRGGRGDALTTLKACDVRATIEQRLHIRGWCYGHKSEVGSQMHWHRCDAASLK